jgi:hypothetical protein
MSQTSVEVIPLQTPLHVGIEDRCHVSEDGKVGSLTADKTVEKKKL